MLTKMSDNDLAEHYNSYLMTIRHSTNMDLLDWLIAVILNGVTTHLPYMHVELIQQEQAKLLAHER